MFEIKSGAARRLPLILSPKTSVDVELACVTSCCGSPDIYLLEITFKCHHQVAKNICTTFFSFFASISLLKKKHPYASPSRNFFNLQM
jgi:hypothetical protein